MITFSKLVSNAVPLALMARFSPGPSKCVSQGWAPGESGELSLESQTLTSSDAPGCEFGRKWEQKPWLLAMSPAVSFDKKWEQKGNLRTSTDEF